jgi:hypothetical protein
MWGKSKEKQYKKTLEAIKFFNDHYRSYGINDFKANRLISEWIEEALTSNVAVTVDDVYKLFKYCLAVNKANELNETKQVLELYKKALELYSNGEESLVNPDGSHEYIWQWLEKEVNKITDKDTTAE